MEVYQNFSVFQALKATVIEQITAALQLLTATNENSEALALIIDGKSLTYALEDDVKDLFLELAIGCASVICCRSSPKQKALVSFTFCFLLLRFKFTVPTNLTQFMLSNIKCINFLSL